MGAVLSQGVAFVLGLVTGLLTPPAQRFILKVRGGIRDRRDGHPLRFDPTTVDFFMLDQWSAQRPLARQRIVQVTREPIGDRMALQSWCDPVELRAIKEALADHGGPACTLVDLEIDHRESERGQQLRLTFEPSVYGDFLAVGEYFRRHPHELSMVTARLQDEDTRLLVQCAPASVVAVNVTVRSDDGHLLAIRRSSSVRTSQNIWTLGPNETMNLPSLRPGDNEDFFELSQRCLREEVGLEPTADYGAILVSWMGYNVPAALVHVVAHVTSRLGRAAIEERLAASHGAFESERVAWIPDHKRALEQIIHHHRKDHEGRSWIDSAPLAAQQYWKSRPELLG